MVVLIASTNQGRVAIAAPQALCAPVGSVEQTAPAAAIGFDGNHAVGQNACHQVTFARNLNTCGAVDLVTPGGQRLRSTISGIVFYEPGGNSVLIAELKPCEAELLSPNQLIYRDAFDADAGMVADVVYEHRRFSLEQNVVFRTQLPAPSDYGFDLQKVRLAVMTEFFEPPMPGRTSSALGAEDNLVFDQMRIVQGRAFTLGESDWEIRVDKTWQELEKRWFLVESVAYLQIAAKLRTLPPLQLLPAPPKHKSASNGALPLPAVPRLAGQGPAWGAGVAFGLSGPGKARQASGPLRSLSGASLLGLDGLGGWGTTFALLLPPPDWQSGVVLDYVIASTHVLNVDFASPAPPQKSGPAAIGQSSLDVWNGFWFPGSSDASLNGPLWSDGSVAAGVTVRAQNAPGGWGFSCADPMYANYIYPWGGQATVTVSGLPGGTYDFYLYGHTWSPGGNSLFELSVSGVSQGTKSTGVGGADWSTVDWKEGQQYVVFRNLNLSGAQAVVISLLPGVDGGAQINGMQIAPAGGFTPPDPACTGAPSGLAGLWRAEGNANDTVGGHNGTLYNGTSFAAGMVGSAFSFNGIQNCVNNAVAGLTSITSSFTIEFWAWPTATRASTAEATCGISGISNERYAIYPNCGDYGPVGAGVSVGNNGVSVFEHGACYLASPLVYDAPILGWTHIAVVYQNAQPRLYVNGTLARTGLTSTRVPYPSTRLGEAGPGSGNYGYYAGLLDEVSIYNRPLSDAEVRAVYTAGSAGKCGACSPPTITTQPQASPRAMQADNVTLTVTAAGTANLSYQWKHNNVNIINNSSAVTSTLALNNVQLADAGVYCVAIVNGCGSATSANANLTVTADSDRDGIADALEDRNGNGYFDVGDMSDFRSADSDGDGVSDGVEYSQNPTGPWTVPDSGGILRLEFRTPVE